jgi:hypothetical protein
MPDGKRDVSHVGSHAFWKNGCCRRVQSLHRCEPQTQRGHPRAASPHCLVAFKFAQTLNARQTDRYLDFMAAVGRNRFMQGRFCSARCKEEVLPPDVGGPPAPEGEILEVLRRCRRRTPDPAIAAREADYREIGVCHACSGHAQDQETKCKSQSFHCCHPLLDVCVRQRSRRSLTLVLCALGRENATRIP